MICIDIWDNSPGYADSRSPALHVLTVQFHGKYGVDVDIAKIYDNLRKLYFQSYYWITVYRQLPPRGEKIDQAELEGLIKLVN